MSGREDAAGNEVAFNLREPQFDLVEPGRIGRREVQVDRRMVMKEHGDLPRLVCGEIIEDHMNGLPPNSPEVCRSAVRPRTSPVRVLKAA